MTCAALLAAMLLATSGSTADVAQQPEPPPRAPPTERLLLQPALFGRANPYAGNPVGVEGQLLVAFQKRLFLSESLLLRDNHVLVGLHPKLNPAMVALGAVAEIQPASFFNLRVAAEYWALFGSFAALQSFSSPTADFSGEAIRDNWTAGRNYGTGGLHLAIAPTLQAAFAGFALRVRPVLDYYRMRLRGGDRFWHNGRSDALLAGDGWVITNDVDLLYTGFTRWTVGLSYSLLVPLYRGTDADYRMQNSYQRVGPVVAYTLFDNGHPSFNRPTMFLLTQWFISHRYAAANASRAIPYAVLGLSVTSDFL